MKLKPGQYAASLAPVFSKWKPVSLNLKAARWWVIGLLLLQFAVVAIAAWQIKRQAQRELEAARAGIGRQAIVPTDKKLLRAVSGDGVRLMQSSKAVRSLARFNDSYFAATDGGLVELSLDGKFKRCLTVLDGLLESDLTAVTAFGSGLFIGTRSQGLVGFDGARFTAYRWTDRKAQAVTSLVEDRAQSGCLLVGTFAGGLLEFDGKEFRERKAEQKRILGIVNLSVESGRLFIATFAAGDGMSGLKLLKLMLDLAWTPTRSAAAAELAALPQVRARAVEAVQVEKPTADNQLMIVESLRLAAETAAEFGQFAAAIEYRRRMLELFPEDYASGRIELARALAANKQEGEAAKLVAMVIANRRASRQQRWMAVWVAPDAVRTLLAEQVCAAGKDQEMIAAVDALAAAQRGQAVSAAKSAGDAAANFHSNQLKLLQALLFRRSGQEREALRSFIGSLVPFSNSAAMAAFASSEDELRWQLVRLYTKQNQSRAALKLAETDE